MDKNTLDLKIGEYLILRDSEGKDIDILKWTERGHEHIVTTAFDSKWFGKVKPYNGDIYQKMLFDSLLSNQITMIKGAPGSGKSYISLAFLMHKLEHHEIDKIVIFCNPVATVNSAKLGFYPGSRTDKLLDSQIGNILISKFGGQDGVNRLLNEEKIVLLPLSDARGYDTTGMRAGIYISEAQNMDITLMKLALQRIGEDCICIIDGDVDSQVDMPQFAGHNNGMRRLSKIFRGQDIYGEITLKNIYRSRIAQIAQDM